MDATDNEAGVSPRLLKKELHTEGLCFDDFGAVLITHDHMDHIRSLGPICKHIGKPVWATPRLHRAMSFNPMTRDWIGRHRVPLMEDDWNPIIPDRILDRPFIIPHDATETIGYAILLDTFKFVIMTDIGRMTPEALNWARQADVIVIESN